MINDAAERVRRCVLTGDFSRLSPKAAQFLDDSKLIANAYSDLAARLAAAEAECSRVKHELDMVRSVARSDNLRAEDADQFEAWLLRLGKLSGCEHVDEQLPNCIEAAYQEMQDRLAAAEARLARYDDARPLDEQWCRDHGWREVGSAFALSIDTKRELNFYADEGSLWLSWPGGGIPLLARTTIGNFAKLVDGLGVKP